MFKHIMCPTDGSELAEKGLNYAISLAKLVNAKLTIVTVSSAVPGYGVTINSEWGGSATNIERYHYEMDEQSKNILEKAKKKALQQGLMDVEIIHAENQTAAQGIIDAAKDCDADLIIMSSHGRKGITKLLLGSQAQEVLTLSEMPVLIVK